jgi:hypothetical protein
VRDELTALKQADGKDIVVTGSASLVQSIVPTGLVDAPALRLPGPAGPRSAALRVADARQSHPDRHPYLQIRCRAAGIPGKPVDQQSAGVVEIDARSDRPRHVTPYKRQVRAADR